MNDLDLRPLILSLQLSSITLVILFAIGLPLAWWLTTTRSRIWKPLIESIVALPLILPPTVLGFYLLLILGDRGWIGGIWSDLGLGSLAFSFTGLIVGSCVYSLPFVCQPLQTAFAGIGTKPLAFAQSLGASKLDYFFTVHLRLARRGILTAAVLGFAHTLGEFGVVLMLGGNIPGKTQVVSIAIYDLVEQLEYARAHQMSLIVLAISFTALAVLYALQNRRPA